MFCSSKKNPYLASLKNHFNYMKRIALLIYLTTFAIATALAVPAKRGKMQHTQSDGTVVTFEVVGDEFGNHLLVDGLYTAIQGDDGDLCFATFEHGLLKSSGVKVRPTNRLSSSEKEVAQQSISLKKVNEDPLFSRQMHSPERAISNRMAAMNQSAPHESALQIAGWGGEIKGKRNLLVILVQYTDIQFTIENPQTEFHNLLNESGYSKDGATGCAVDYFEDASSGQFNPTFDVVGPFTLSHNRKYYGGNNSYGDDQAPAIQAKEACDLADAAGVDFSKYDANGDGDIDLVFIVYAGHNPAEGGPAEAIWPHQWDIYPGQNIVEKQYPNYDGKDFVTYACTSELKGSGRGGIHMSSIGTFCHEFGHAIGLPDWYDTQNNVCFGMDYASIMHGGNYLNESRTPPTYNILERWLLGWALPKEIHSAGLYEVEHVSKNDGYILWANQDMTECFLFEARTKAANCKWDKYLNDGDRTFGLQGGEGMLVYHVDWSGSYLNKWRTHTINTDPNHQCATIFRSNPSATTENSKGWFFPGSRNITTISYEGTPVFQNWAFERLPYYFTDIAIDGAKVTFNAQMKELSVDTRQYDAIANWEASDKSASEWRVVFTNDATGESREIKTTQKYAMLYPLATETHYSAAIYADNDTEPCYEFIITTQTNVMIPRSALLVDATHKSEDLIRLSVKDLDCTPEQITWYVDGKKSDAYLRLNPGKHQICAVITDTEGNTEYLYRYITVK